MRALVFYIGLVIFLLNLGIIVAVPHPHSSRRALAVVGLVSMVLMLVGLAR